MRPVAYPVLARRRLCPDVFLIELDAPGLAQRVKPGQFLNIRVGDGPDPLLRRPLSVCDADEGRVRLAFRVVGRGTALLARTRTGDRLDVLGPLGRPAPAPRNRNVLLVGGGIGIAPLLFTARRLATGNRVHAVLGARTREQLILRREFRALGTKPILTTDDGSLGFPGPVIEPAADAAAKLDRPLVFTCGPKPMLRALVRRLDPVPVWGFIEERMGCGTGICYCCALPRKGGGWVRFCADGPVVLLNEVAW
ncbi:MAG TPA: dihydroorotate dehydrogenase electron transfer subunit [candidate division WOR-3 bacterium]|uniref:Dihydroorotate dehydrogenase electron transfer subunit n=1 Tax=candidate division WOR-3 bacterium TaxID=2052148 RepID=A0A7V0XFI9_UNCW3|nr:dihydroorotate dehydrogenase electron transfer subunit [candidate division WOR-3 bacterium]